MHPHISEQIHPGIITIQGMLWKIDCLRLPLASRRDVESILVRQVCREIDRALPWQAGHGRRTAAISLLIGRAVGMTAGELHDLKLAAFLHDLGLLMLPHDLTIGVPTLDSESYITVQNHPRLGASLLEPFFFLREASVLVAHPTNDGTDQAIRMASGDDSFPLDPGSSRLPTPSTPSASPKSRTGSCATRSHSEFSESQPAPNLTRS
jgi:hypothetical protein